MVYFCMTLRGDVLIVAMQWYLHMKNRTKEMMQMMLMMTEMPTKTVAARKAGDKMVPKSSRRPRQISVPSWLKMSKIVII